MSRGRAEAQITVPSGGWALSLTVTAIGGPTTVTVAAGTYFPTDLLSTLKTQLDAAFGGDGVFTVSGSFGESGTGLVTISHTVETFTISWTSTDLRDALGFAGNLTPAATSFVGTKNAKGVWLPSCDLDAPRGRDSGATEIDREILIAPNGTITALGYQSRRSVRITWSQVSRARTLESGETTTGESFERWWLDSHGGGVSYFGLAPQVRVYWDADAATKITIRLTEPSDTFDPQRVDSQWIGLWIVVVGGLLVPGA